MSTPQIIFGGNEGHHNLSPNTQKRIEKGQAYKDLSTVCVIPTRGAIDARVVESWWSLMPPMNQKFMRVIVKGMEVAEAYNSAIEQILAHPELSQWKYMLTLEEDNMPPPDGLIKLYENIEDYACIGGLYWTKGDGGQPMIYGKPGQIPEFAPQMPEPDKIVEANGLGMGFNLWKLDLFKDEKLPKPWFKTLNEWSPEKGSASMTQDLYAFKNIRDLGYKVACDTRVKVGHYDSANDIVW